jgi:hypothetical protein
MKKLNDTLPWATIIMGALVLIAAAVGGAVVIWGKPGALSFQEYLNMLKTFAVAVGILGVGRGIASYGRQSSQASMLDDTSLSAIGPPSDTWRVPDLAPDLGNVAPPPAPQPGAPAVNGG